MTGVELQKYLSNLGIFREHNVYMVEIIDGEIYNRVPTNYTMRINNRLYDLDIRIFYKKNYEYPLFDNKTKWIDFSIGNNNLFASYKLEELDLPMLVKEIGKIIGDNTRFIEWSKSELRDWKINSVIK